MSSNLRWKSGALTVIADLEADEQMPVEHVQAKLQSLLALWEGSGEDVLFDRVDLAENQLENVLFVTRREDHRAEALARLLELRSVLTENSGDVS